MPFGKPGFQQTIPAKICILAPVCLFPWESNFLGAPSGYANKYGVPPVPYQLKGDTALSGTGWNFAFWVIVNERPLYLVTG